MKIIVFCYPKCSTCKKAENWLKENNIAYEYRDITQNTPSKKELETFYVDSGLPLKKFFNTSGLKYRELGLSTKLPDMLEDEQLSLLSTDGMLIKRPLLIKDGAVLVGFNDKKWEEAFHLTR